ncbi:MAG: CoA transferase [Rhodoferax sp.]
MAPIPSRPLPLRPLKGARILSLALNLPGPAALMRCRQMGAHCVKLEPPAPAGEPKDSSGDPMGQYSVSSYQQLSQGVRIAHADLKSEAGQKVLHRELAKSDVLITSFRPSALRKLGLGWKALHRLYPALSMVAIYGAIGAAAEQPGHDLTYLAESDLVTGLDLPPTLYADMGGSLMASEAVLGAYVQQLKTGKGSYQQVGLAQAAAYLALPRSWGLTTPGAAVGGGHAGYRVYACQDGRVAVAALEPHFAAALGAAVGLEKSHMLAMFAPQTQQAFSAFFARHTRRQLEQLARERDIPLHTLA